jgi:hypothetical protein
MVKRPFKVGDRVYLRLSPENVGTVAKTTPDCFVVVYDELFDKRQNGAPRSRWSYLWTTSPRFALGEPPAPKPSVKEEAA